MGGRARAGRVAVLPEIRRRAGPAHGQPALHAPHSSLAALARAAHTLDRAAHRPRHPMTEWFPLNCITLQPKDHGNAGRAGQALVTPKIAQDSEAQTTRSERPY